MGILDDMGVSKLSAKAFVCETKG